jgi:hypothetical protein
LTTYSLAAINKVTEKEATMKLYAVTYEGFGITKIGVTRGSVTSRAKQIGFLKSDRIRMASIEIEDSDAEVLAHMLAEKKGGKAYEVVVSGNFQDPKTGQGFKMNSGQTEVFAITFLQAKHVLKEVKSFLKYNKKTESPLLEISGSRSFKWEYLPVEEL